MIELKNITKIYKTGEVETNAIKNVNLKIDKGEFVAIMGPSGSGKSTLMHIIGLLDRPTLGEYFLEEVNTNSLDDYKLAELRNKKIGFVFQSFYLLPRKNILENVILPMIYAGTDKSLREQKAKIALESAAFPENFIYHYPKQISGGMMQRVAIARALVNEPEIILADEPTGNLDTKTGEIIIHTLQKLNLDKGITVVLITHEEYIAQHSERIIKIKDGEIIDELRVKNRKILYHNNET